MYISVLKITFCSLSLSLSPPPPPPLRVCFERLTWHPALMSFVLSAIWHGFYPGYYACFIYLGLGVEAGKKVSHWGGEGIYCAAMCVCHRGSILLLWATTPCHAGQGAVEYVRNFNLPFGSHVLAVPTLGPVYVYMGCGT